MVVSAMLLVTKRLNDLSPDALNAASQTVANVLASERTPGKRLRLLRLAPASTIALSLAVERTFKPESVVNNTT